MVNIYLFIELLHTANAPITIDTLKVPKVDGIVQTNIIAVVRPV